MSKRRNQKRKTLEDLPSDVIIYKIFRFSEVYEVLYVFTLLNKSFHQYSLKSLLNREEKKFHLLYFGSQTNLNVSEWDMIQLLRIETFDIEKCGMSFMSYCVDCGYRNALLEFFRFLTSNKEKFPFQSEKWNDKTSILCVDNNTTLRKTSFEEEDTTYLYDSDPESEEEEYDNEEDIINSISLKEEEEEEDDDDDDSEILTYQIFFSGIDFENNTNENFQFYERNFQIKYIEKEILEISLVHNDLELIKLSTQCFKLFEVHKEFLGQYVGWKTMKVLCGRIKKSLEYNNDEISCYLLQKYELSLEFEQFLEITDLAIHSTCRKCTDLLIKADRIEDYTRGCDGSDTTEVTDLYFNSFFCGKRYDDDDSNNKSTLGKLIDGTLDEDDEGGSKYSKIIGEDFLLDGNNQNYRSEFSFKGNEKRMEAAMSYLYKFPVKGRIRGEFEDDSSSSDEEQHEKNKNYQSEEFFENEKKERYGDDEKLQFQGTDYGLRRHTGMRMFHLRSLMGRRRVRITSKDILKLMRKAGVMAANGMMWMESQYILNKFLENVLRLSVEFCKERMEKCTEEEGGEGVEDSEWKLTEEDVRNGVERYLKNNCSQSTEKKTRKHMEMKENDMGYMKGFVQ